MKIFGFLFQTLMAMALLFIVLGCQDKTRSATISNEYAAYFCHSYRECRQQFRQQSAKWQQPGAILKAIVIPSKIDDDLTIDYLYLPASSKQQKLLVISSGVHGIEGYMGSAVIRFFMDRYLAKLDRNNMGILLLHSVNPYGMKYQRRVTENNVDLNRNAATDPGLFSIKNEGYSQLVSFLNPTESLDLSDWQNRLFFARSFWRIAFDGLPKLRQAVLQGQYQFPDGLYFGGQQFEPNIERIKELLLQVAKNYQIIYNIDIHTGYGERGKLHLFPNPIDDATRRQKTQAMFEGFSIDWGDSGDFYTVTGAFSDMFASLLPEKEHYSMAFEYGTLDSQTTSGSITSIHNMIVENQGFHHGYADEENRLKTTEQFLEMYYPSSPQWRFQTMKQTSALLDSHLNAWQKLQP